MKTLARIIMSLVLATPVAFTSVARADDNKTPPSADKESADKQDVTMDQLPRAVKATVQREAKGKNIQSMTKSTGNGAVKYEVTYLAGTKETTIDVGNDGKVLGRHVKTAAEPNPPGSPSQPREDTRANDTKPNDTKPNEPKPNEPKPNDTKPDDTQRTP